MAGTQVQNLTDFIIDTQIINNLAHFQYSNGNRSCCGHPSCDLRQDRQLSGLQGLFPKHTDGPRPLNRATWGIIGLSDMRHGN